MTRHNTKTCHLKVNENNSLAVYHAVICTVLTYESVSLVASVKARRSLLRLFWESVWGHSNNP
ncbi:CLUMA_CG005480, isoform A [Clunio marinus]|uniref:CLUMA_CG005480, isoform A n=1 Tax=Clunio marinus TaxID=568069 RepID=A0A1J1HV31_9DIPT|nr:CLUMA_CG005480, isoform A [Clunio marinus]